MTIGKKIGTGFCVVILLTIVLGFWAIYSISSGANVAEIIAEDRFPRFATWTQMQNAILNASYYGKSYFADGNEEDIQKTYVFLKQFDAGLEAIAKLNSKIHYATTNDVIKKTRKDLDRYSQMMHTDQETYLLSEKLVNEMMITGASAREAFGQLIKTMSVTLEKFIDDGNTNAARSYARNLSAAHDVYAQISDVCQDLLYAERNNDLKAFAKVQSRLPEIVKTAQEVNKKLLREECHKLFADTFRTYEIFAGIADKVADTLKSYLISGNARYELFQDIYKNTIRMVELTTKNSRTFVNTSVNSLNHSRTVISILLAIVTLFGIGVAVYITRLIVRPLAATQQFAQEVAAGDLDRTLGVNTNDETGKLANALRSMVSSLKQTIHEAKDKSVQAEKATESANAATARAEEAARQAEYAKRDGMLQAANQLEGMVEIISSASSQLSAQIKQSDEGATESAQRLQEAATAMNEMNASVQEVARNAASASEASADTMDKAQIGQQVVHEVVNSMSEMHTISLTLKEDMSQLGERAQDINRIMGVISDIADQTNLLALNAAIEAARAGEAGRGFAVVADEVRKLAEKTMTSTQDVSNAIHAIQDSARKSMAAVDATVASIDKATQFANQSGGALEEIVDKVEATTSQVQAIAAASEEQSAASEQINRSIIEVNNMSRQTAEAMGEASTAISDLANQAQKLTGLIAEMKSE